MKISYLTPTSIWAGGENVTLGIARAMQQRGHEVTYIGLEGPIRQVVESSGVSFAALPAFKICAVRRILQENVAQMVHCMDFKASAYAALTGLPFVAHLHNNPPWLRGFGPNAWGMFLFALRARALITVSPAVWSEYSLKRLCPQSCAAKLHMLPNCVDVAQVRQRAARQILPAFDLLFMGRFVPQKRPERFVECVAGIRNALPEVKAVMLGQGELLPEIKSRIAALGLEKHITLAGQQENPFPWIAASRVLIMTSAWEGFGLAAVEALALGKPVVATPVGGLKEIVDNTCGALCNSAQEQAAAACRLLRDKALYAACSAAAERRALLFSNFDQYYNIIESLYKS